MNDKQREIEADIKRQMIALSAQMDALNVWKATGYNSEICTPALHDWEQYNANNSERNITLHLECIVCGIQTTRYYNFSDEVITDKWTDFREDGEEE
tara:strand:+ start:112 stop:402 length:291 start_codon:yes stop_codon:yes gene_type:complete